MVLKPQTTQTKTMMQILAQTYTEIQMKQQKNTNMMGLINNQVAYFFAILNMGPLITFFVKSLKIEQD